MPRNSSVTDTRLIRRSQQGDRRAFRALLTRYDWRLRGLAHALLLDPELVDAVLRVAYVKAWREVVRIDGRDDASAWLYRVVYNACIDGLRREGTRVGAAPPAAADVPAAADAPGAAGAATEVPVQGVPAGGGNGATPATDRHRRERVVEELAALAPADRVAVVLVDREGFAAEAAARILGLTPEVVEARLAGARARLTRQLADVLAAAPAPAGEARAQAGGVEAKTAQPEEQADQAQPDGQAQPEASQSREPPPDEQAQPDGLKSDGQAQPEQAQPDGLKSDEQAQPEAAQSGEPQPDEQAQPDGLKSDERAQPEQAQSDGQAQPGQAQPDGQAQPEAAQSGEPQPDEQAQPDGQAQPEASQSGEPPPDEQAQPDGLKPDEQARPNEQPEEPRPDEVPVPAASDEQTAGATAEAEGSAPAEPEDTKVASHSAAVASPNGASGVARSNGSDDTGGGAS